MEANCFAESIPIWRLTKYFFVSKNKTLDLGVDAHRDIAERCLCGGQASQSLTNR